MIHTARTSQFIGLDRTPVAPSATRAVHLIIMALMAFAMALVMVAPAAAQGVETFDPDEAYPQTSTGGGAIDADLADPRVAAPQRVPEPARVPVQNPPGSDLANDSDPGFNDDFSVYSQPPSENPDGSVSWTDPANGASVGSASGETGIPIPEPTADTYAEDDLIGAAEGVFGKGAEGLARMIEDLLEKEGKPNGYIVGREAGGAFVVGARYGSGTLHHKVEGQQKVYWTGPSIGFDAGANAANTFVLVYNLFDSEDLFRRYPAGEGQAYFIGGLHASYMRRGDVVLIPIRLGAGVRLGVNAGYMRFSKKQRWLPF